jgi:hypothetical protein
LIYTDAGSSLVSHEILQEEEEEREQQQLLYFFLADVDVDEVQLLFLSFSLVETSIYLFLFRTGGALALYHSFPFTIVSHRISLSIDTSVFHCMLTPVSLFG